MRKFREDQLRPTKHCPQMRVSWRSVPKYHGVLTIVIIHSAKEREEYVLQQVPRKIYFDLLAGPGPEALMNQLLRMYLGSGE